PLLSGTVWLCGLLLGALALASGLAVWCVSARAWWPLLCLGGLFVASLIGAWWAHKNAIPPKDERRRPAPVFIRLDFPPSATRERVLGGLDKALDLLQRHRDVWPPVALIGHCPLGEETMDHVVCLEVRPIMPDYKATNEALAREL